MAPKLQKVISFQLQLQIQCCLCQNSQNHFLLLSVHSYNMCLLHFFSDCMCLLAIGNVVSELLFEVLQDQTFEESQLFFADQQGKSP
jgi:hypothetical protein